MSGQQMAYFPLCPKQSPKVTRRNQKQTKKTNCTEEVEKKAFQHFQVYNTWIWEIISEFQSMLFTTLKLGLMRTSEDAPLKICFKRKCNIKKIKD